MTKNKTSYNQNIFQVEINYKSLYTFRLLFNNTYYLRQFLTHLTIFSSDNLHQMLSLIFRFKYYQKNKSENNWNLCEKNKQPFQPKKNFGEFKKTKIAN